MGNNSIYAVIGFSEIGGVEFTTVKLLFPTQGTAAGRAG